MRSRSRVCGASSSGSVFGRAHARAVSIVGTTMTPFEGATIEAGYYGGRGGGDFARVSALMARVGAVRERILMGTSCDRSRARPHMSAHA
jgi:hypothetical protein